MPGTPSTADIRKFLTEAFNDEELISLCSDFFRDVCDQFTLGMTKGQKIQLLLDYCQRREAIPNLLAAIQRVRSEQYEKQFPQSPHVEAPPAFPKPQRDPKQVFISHAHEDAEFAHRLADDLGQRGWCVWITPDSIHPGEKWAEAIERGLSESGAFVVALTPDAVRSRWVRDETFVAIELEKKGQVRFVPLSVEPCDVPHLWGAYQRIPFEHDYGHGLTELLDTLEPERRTRREREAQEQAARARAEQLEREMEARRQAVQAEAERQVRLAAEKVEAEQLERARRDREAQEKAARDEAKRQVRLVAQRAEAKRKVQKKVVYEAQRKELEQAAREKVSTIVTQVRGWPWYVWIVSVGLLLLIVTWMAWPRGQVTIANIAGTLKAHASPTAPTATDIPIAIVIPTVANTPTPEPTIAPTPLPTDTPTLIPTNTETPTNTPTLTPLASATHAGEIDGMALIYIPAGEFLMGSSDADKQAGDDEKPQHRVYLDAFWIDRNEVTNAQYRKCVQAKVCRASPWTYTLSDNQPEEGMDWYSAKAYCEWVGRRLPTEAEWEKAARGTDGRIYPWGNQPATCEYAVMKGCTGVGRTWGIGSKPKGASPYGVLDMAGSVYEWVADWYDAKYYSISPARNPKGPLSGQTRVFRGGSYADDSISVRSTERVNYPPELWGGFVGIRCAR